MKNRLFSSWRYIDPASQEELEALFKASGKFSPESGHQVLWQTRSKFVLLIELPSGKKVVYKAPLRIKNFLKYCLRPGPYGKEALNFCRIRSMGIPTVDFLAAGESRTCFKLKHGFLITEFAEGFSSGFDFVHEGGKNADLSLLNEFVERNFRLLARMHDHNFIHKGFTPANLLYRKKAGAAPEGNQLDILWIDLASCHKINPFLSRNAQMAQDLAAFFGYFNFSDEEKCRYLAVYLQERKLKDMTPEKLLRLM